MEHVRSRTCSMARFGFYGTLTQELSEVEASSQNAGKPQPGSPRRTTSSNGKDPF